LLGEKGQFLTCIFAECAGKNRPLLRTLKIVGTEEGGVDKMSSFKQRMDEARGLVKIDLVLRNARLVNVFSGEIHKTDIGIHQGNFVGIGKFEYAEKELDLCGNYVVPGLIDGHVHIESSLLCPEEFCSLLLSHGVTTAVVDPHEIANVFGSKGIRYILDSVENLPFNTFVALPSCVPATDLETSGACLEAKDLYKFIADPKVIGLGEVMDFLGVIQAKPDMVEKLELPVSFFDGHAPGISPQDLNAYYLAGIHTEHECSTVEEVRERLRRGFHVMLREGSAAKNLLDLLPAVTPKNAGQCLLVTDDRHPIDLIREGSIKELTGSVHLGSWSRTKLRVLANNQRDMTAQVWVIGVQEHSLITSALVRELPVIDGLIQTDQTQGIAKLAVLERHHETGNVGVGFVEGLGLKKGAIASTVAHDSHNLVVVGMSDEEMNLAILTCVEMGGGLCLVDGDQVIGKLSLSIAGLMSDQEAEVVAKTLGELHERAHSLGISETVDPFMTLAFLSLPVIPELKLTDLGLVDVEHFQLIKTVRLSKQNPIYSI
jgi:adenine deaminase